MYVKKSVMIKYIFLIFIVFTAQSCNDELKKKGLLKNRFYLKEINKSIEFQNKYGFKSINYKLNNGQTAIQATYCLVDSLGEEIIYFEF